MKKLNIFLLVMSISLLLSCDKDNETYDNKVFLKTSSKVNELILKGSTPELTRNIQAAIAKPEQQEVKITYKPDFTLVDNYNKAYSDKAVALPAPNFELAKTEASIPAGNVTSDETLLKFKDLSKLNRETIFVLPITIASASINVLESARTMYYVVKAGALINVVADIEENYLTIDWKKPEVCNNLSTLTMEALIKVRNYDKMISTVMGIEGQFLIRLGDAGFPSNQIQVATNRGNFPDGDSKKGLPTNEWTHIALTYNSADGKMIIYVNGKKQSEDTKNVGKVNLGRRGVNGFCIGRSYANDRFLSGEISECRIWNVVRTQEEIATNSYSVAPDTKGLVAYWKFDDEQPLTIRDHTANGNNAIASKTLKWVQVSLPKAK
ncbi:MAG: DUF1735 and LamG domain-containing protein [Bacteroidia bacterium]|nr:DUF1735 and LamG domain-containing protein [Bacteroidia bacterium]